MIQHAFVRVSEIFALQQYSSAPIYQKIWKKVNEFQEKGINSLDKFQSNHLKVSSISFVLFCTLSFSQQYRGVDVKKTKTAPFRKSINIITSSVFTIFSDSLWGILRLRYWSHECVHRNGKTLWHSQNGWDFLSESVCVWRAEKLSLHCACFRCVSLTCFSLLTHDIRKSDLFEYSRLIMILPFSGSPSLHKHFISSGGSRGARDSPQSIFFIPMQFLTKTMPNNRLAPNPCEILAPTLGDPRSATDFDHYSW